MSTVSNTTSTAVSTLSSMPSPPPTPSEMHKSENLGEDHSATDLGQKPSSMSHAQRAPTEDASLTVVTTTTATTISLPPAMSTKHASPHKMPLRKVQSTRNLEPTPSSMPHTQQASLTLVSTTTITSPSTPTKSRAATPCGMPHTSPNKTFKLPSNIPIPHPSELQRPPPGTTIKGYYVITVGQEVGIFYTWNDINARVSHVSGNEQSKYSSWDEALAVYSAAYRKGTVKAKPFMGGPFDPSKAAGLVEVEEGETAWDLIDVCTDSEDDGDLARFAESLSL